MIFLCYKTDITFQTTDFQTKLREKETAISAGNK